MLYTSFIFNICSSNVELKSILILNVDFISATLKELGYHGTILTFKLISMT